MTISASVISEFGALDCVGNLGRNRAAAVVGDSENWAVQERLYKIIRRIDQPDSLPKLIDSRSRRTIGVAQINCDRNDRSVEHRGATLRWVLADHAVLPNVVGTSIQIDAGSFKMTGEIHDRIDPLWESMRCGDIALLGMYFVELTI